MTSDDAASGGEACAECGEPENSPWHDAKRGEAHDFQRTKPLEARAVEVFELSRSQTIDVLARLVEYQQNHWLPDATTTMMNDMRSWLNRSKPATLDAATRAGEPVGYVLASLAERIPVLGGVELTLSEAKRRWSEQTEPRSILALVPILSDAPPPSGENQWAGWLTGLDKDAVNLRAARAEIERLQHSADHWCAVAHANTTERSTFKANLTAEVARERQRADALARQVEELEGEVKGWTERTHKAENDLHTIGFDYEKKLEEAERRVLYYKQEHEEARTSEAGLNAALRTAMKERDALRTALADAQAANRKMREALLGQVHADLADGPCFCCPVDSNNPHDADCLKAKAALKGEGA